MTAIVRCFGLGGVRELPPQPRMRRALASGSRRKTVAQAALLAAQSRCLCAPALPPGVLTTHYKKRDRATDER